MSATEGMNEIIVLHGKYAGMVRLVHDGKRLRTMGKGIPQGSKVFVVSGDTPYPVDKQFRGRIAGVIVTDANFNVIMEGRARFASGNNEIAKMKLSFLRSTEPSSALSEILERTRELFSDCPSIETTEKTNPTPPCEKKQNAYNPFSSTYPNSTWKKVFHKHDRAYHIVGTANVGSEKLSIVAVPVRFYSEAYFRANGFIKPVQADDGTMCRMKVKRAQQGNE